jgi:Bax protein
MFMRFSSRYFFVMLSAVMIFGSCQSSDFDRDKITTEKKLPESHKQFIATFYPGAVEANRKIKLDRALILDLRNDYTHVIRKGRKLEELNQLAKTYRLGDRIFTADISRSVYRQHIDSLLLRVDYIPEKLVMAQAIIESGWGNSEFSREINNSFGIHCHTPGCGRAPSGVENPKFWVKSFPTPEACIEEYMWNLNTGFAYHGLRKKRLELRNEGNYPNAILLAQGLLRYSEKGSEYITLIESIINNYLPDDLAQFVKYIDAGEPELS